MKKHIPNIITLLNLIAGGIAATEAVKGNFDHVIILIIASAVFDFADGLVARALHVKSELGKELDSLADVVSFGLVPGLVVFRLMSDSLSGAESYLPYLAFLLPAFAAYRLAKFNLDTRQTDSFLGVPTPAMALFFIMLPLASLVNGDGSFLVSLMRWVMASWPALALLVVVFSLLMISELPLLALKFRNFSWKSNQSRYLMMAGSVLILALLGVGAMPLVIVWYVAFSFVISKIAL